MEVDWQRAGCWDVDVRLQTMHRLVQHVVTLLGQRLLI